MVASEGGREIRGEGGQTGVVEQEEIWRGKNLEGQGFGGDQVKCDEKQMNWGLNLSGKRGNPCNEPPTCLVLYYSELDSETFRIQIVLGYNSLALVHLSGSRMWDFPDSDSLIFQNSYACLSFRILNGGFPDPGSPIFCWKVPSLGCFHLFSQYFDLQIKYKAQ